MARKLKGRSFLSLESMFDLSQMSAENGGDAMDALMYIFTCAYNTGTTTEHV